MFVYWLVFVALKCYEIVFEAYFISTCEFCFGILGIMWGTDNGLWDMAKVLVSQVLNLRRGGFFFAIYVICGTCLMAEELGFVAGFI